MPNENAKAQPPQRIIRLQEVCDRCKAVDSFRVLTASRGYTYVRCNKCGRHGTRITVARNSQKVFHTEQHKGE